MTYTRCQSGQEHGTYRTGYGYHVDDLGEGDLQSDIDDVIRVLHWPQGVGVVGEQVSHQLLSKATMSSKVHYTERMLVLSRKPSLESIPH